MEKATLTISETAEYLNVSERTAYRMVADAQITGLKIRGSLRILRKSIDDYIDRMVSNYALENGYSLETLPDTDTD
jgi:excisionase family DNA binding protein